MEIDMVLNPEQHQAVASGGPVALNVAGTDCVLLRHDIYIRLDPDFDAGPWTLDEMNLLADEANDFICQREAHEP